MEDENKSEYKEKDSFFNQVVREAVRQLKSDKSAYCFSLEQVKEICKQVPDTKYRLIEGIYYLERRDKDGR